MENTYLEQEDLPLKILCLHRFLFESVRLRTFYYSLVAEIVVSTKRALLMSSAKISALTD